MPMRPGVDPGVAWLPNLTRNRSGVCPRSTCVDSSPGIHADPTDLGQTGSALLASRLTHGDGTCPYRRAPVSTMGVVP